MGCFRFSVFLFIMVFSTLCAQTQQWLYYYSKLPAYQLAADNNYIWVKNEGIIRIDINDNAIKKFKTVTSAIPSNSIGTIPVDLNEILLSKK